MNNSKFVLGLLVLVFGGLLLASNFGYLPEGFWQSIWKFWPVLLIIWGISTLFSKKEKNSNQIGLIITVVIILGMISAAIWQVQRYGNRDRSQESISEANLQNEVNLDVKFGAAELGLNSNTSNNIAGDINSYGEVRSERKDVGETTNLNIDQVSGNPSFWIGKGAKNEINLSLPKAPDYRITLDTGASKFDLNFEEIKLNKLDINGGACSGEIRLGDNQSLTSVSISSGASSFNIKVPTGVALKVNDDSGFSSLDYDDISLNKNGKEYKTSDYDSAAKRIEIKLSTGASSIKIERY